VISIKKQAVISVAMLGGAVVISVLLYLNRPSAEIAEPAYKPVTVDAAQVVKQNLRIPVQAQGTVSPLRETALQAEVSGRIIEAAENFLVGGFIATGDVMLRIDPRDYQTGSLRAQSALRSAESSLAQEKGRAQVALREWNNLPKGGKRSQDATDLYLRKPQLAEAEARLLAAQADLNTARDNLERTIIKAPYDALISAKHGELGQFVTVGTPLADIFSVEQAEVRLPIPQSKLDYLELPTGLEAYQGNAKVDLYTEVAGERKQWVASLHRTEGVFDERSRVLYTIARIEDPYALKDPAGLVLRMGTFVNANIQGRELQGVVSLPRYILRAGNLLWVIDKDNVLRNRQVAVLRAGGDQIYVSAGLEDGELVCLTMMDSSFTGATVTLQSNTPSNELRQDGQALVKLSADREAASE
jgi:RND family efflux transporter MFP subunit